MKIFVLLVFIPSLITADILCPNSKITCPEDKLCCEIDGKYSCCNPDDSQDAPAGTMKVYPGLEIIRSTMFKNRSFSSNQSVVQFGIACDLFCSGTCCEDSCCLHSHATCCDGNKCCPPSSTCCEDGCCPNMATCCGGNRCCPDFSRCCEEGGCCPNMATCCGDHCCAHEKQCCGGHCCDGTCCGDTCCAYGTVCCESWCCQEGARCGSSYQTCINKGTTISSKVVVLLLMAASIYISHRL